MNLYTYFWQRRTRSLSVVWGANPRIYRLVRDRVSTMPDLAMEDGGGDDIGCIIGGAL